MVNALGELLRTARNAKGLTQGQVGAHVGISYSAVGQYETGTIKKPRPDRLVAIADLLGIKRETLSQRMLESYGLSLEGRSATDVVSQEIVPARSRKVIAPPPREVELAIDAPSFDRIGGARDVPELGISVGGEEGDFTLNGEVVGYVTRPLSLRGRNVFAVRVKGTSMYPRFREGDVLYVERHREPAIGDDGVFEMKPSDEWRAGQAFVKELISKSMGTIRVKQFNPLDEFSYRRDEIRHMYRVVPRNELLSV